MHSCNLSLLLLFFFFVVVMRLLWELFASGYTRMIDLLLRRSCHRTSCTAVFIRCRRSFTLIASLATYGLLRCHLGLLVDRRSFLSSFDRLALPLRDFFECRRRSRDRLHLLVVGVDRSCHRSVFTCCCVVLVIELRCIRSCHRTSACVFDAIALLAPALLLFSDLRLGLVNHTVVLHQKHTRWS